MENIDTVALLQGMESYKEWMDCFNEFLSSEMDKEKDSEPFSRQLNNLWKHYFLKSIMKQPEHKGTTEFLMNY